MDPFSHSFGAFTTLQELEKRTEDNYTNSKEAGHLLIFQQETPSRSNTSASSKGLDFRDEWTGSGHLDRDADPEAETSLAIQSTRMEDIDPLFHSPSYNLNVQLQESNTVYHKPDNLSAFRAEIERSRKQKRESARRVAVDTLQTDVTGYTTPRLTDSSLSNTFETWANLNLAQDDSITQWTNIEDDIRILETAISDENLSLTLKSANASTIQPTAKAKISPKPDPSNLAPTSPPKPKKTRKRKPKSAEEIETRRKAFLSRNREAASRCRGKKKEWTQQLEEDLSMQMLMNGELRKEHELLVEEIGRLRAAVEGCGVSGGEACAEADDGGTDGGRGIIGEEKENAGVDVDVDAILIDDLLHDESDGEQVTHDES